ncbi:fimbrial protein, partial [Enterobacter hormaechei]|uniref:fimbrial protein n=2 Tax=Enterobacter hormaechei TaxID=158836 RepID=UPI0031378708
WLMMSLWDALRMNMMISYQELVRTFLSTSFSGTLATSTTATMGALLNEKAGSGMAKGIGIQVLKDGSPLQFNKKYTVVRLNNQETRYITIPLHARFYQYGPTTSTGEVESHMIFNLTYD